MIALAVVLALAASPAGEAKAPDCPGWPTNMSLAHLKNASLLDPAQVDHSRTRAVRLAAEDLGKGAFREVYDITFYAKSGKPMEVITSNEASFEECSMSGVTVYVVGERLGGP